MADDPRKLRKLLEILNENNVTSYKDGDLEIHICKPPVVAERVEVPLSYSLNEFGEPDTEKSNGSYGESPRASELTEEQWLLSSADGGMA